MLNFQISQGSVAT